MSALRKVWSKYGPAVVAVAAAVGSAVVMALTGDQRVDAGELSTIVLAFASAAAVFTAPEVPGARYVKVALALLVSVTTPALLALVSDGVSLTDAYALLVAGLGAVGVRLAPYEGSTH